MIAIMIVIIVTMIIIKMIILIVIVIILIIDHSTLDLLGVEFHYFSIYGISILITQVTCLKSLCGLTFFFIFFLIVFLLILSFNNSFF